MSDVTSKNTDLANITWDVLNNKRTNKKEPFIIYLTLRLNFRLKFSWAFCVLSGNPSQETGHLRSVVDLPQAWFRAGHLQGLH